MSLDDKLKEIHVVMANHMMAPYGKPVPTWYELTDEEITQIKQVFIDEGYIETSFKNDEHVERYAKALARGRLMTGQEWYDRFYKELDIDGDVNLVDVVRAAKKASGL